MKKIINGKLYNTDTASEIAQYQHGYVSDFKFICEGLYRTLKGTYFVAGEGGPMTAYRESCGNNSFFGSENIRLISEDEAKTWLEENGFVDEYEKIFEVEEG